MGIAGEFGTAAHRDTNRHAWGLLATAVSSSRFSGKGVKLAVLDTGFDLAHPDFQGRALSPKSFIAEQTVQDGNGHGTHCVGAACGPKAPIGSRRYGVAFGADIFVGKVLSNQGSGSTSGIIAGIEWALTSGCTAGVPALPHDERPLYEPRRRDFRRLALAHHQLDHAQAGDLRTPAASPAAPYRGNALGGG